MVYSEKEFKKLQQELEFAKQKNMKLSKENITLKSENRTKREYISDLEKHSYKNENISLKNENEVLKKKVLHLEGLLGIVKVKLEKDSSNSCKPSSTDGFKKVIQNNRVKSGRKPR